MSLSYLRDDCHKQAVTHIRELRRFESMYTLQRKTRPTRHTLFTLNPCMVQDHTYLTRSTYSNISHSHQQIWTDPLLPRRMAPYTTPSPVEWSASPYPASLLNQLLKQWEKPNFCWHPTTKLTRLINTSMRSVRSVLAHGGQLIGP
jgi:hypothetical protein